MLSCSLHDSSKWGPVCWTLFSALLLLVLWLLLATNTTKQLLHRYQGISIVLCWLRVAW